MRRHEKDSHADERDFHADEEESSGEEMEDEGEESIAVEEEESDDAKDSRIWGSICQSVWKELEIPEDITADELLKDKEFLKQASKGIREKIVYWVDTVNFLENDSETYAKIQKTVNRLMKNDEYDEIEATKQAFKQRKHLMKDIMKKNRDILEEVLNEMEEEDETQTDVEEGQE